MGYADSPATKSVLASQGIRVSGYRWRWAPGLKGGTFPPHRHVNGQVRAYAEDFDAEPGDDVNGDSCMCWLVPAYRTQDGRLAKPGLEPVFQPPVTAAQTMDWTPLTAALAEAFATPQPVSVTIPDGAIVINLPRQTPPTVNVPLSDIRPPEIVVNVPKSETPIVNVQAPNVTVQPPAVNVEAPVVTVEPTIEIPKPAAPRMLPPPKPRETRIMRDNAGQIIGMEEVT